MSEALKLFRRNFGLTPPHVVRAPGRLELLGNHTDHNEGLVLTLAVHPHLTMAVAPRTDHQVELVSGQFEGSRRLAVSRLARDVGGHWSNYVAGVLVQLQSRGIPPRGFNAALNSTIPPGGGLGSSAALEVATALAFRELYPFRLTETGTAAPPDRDARGKLPPLSKTERLALARLCRDAENRFIGLNCGLLDPVACLFGRAFHAIELDCQSEAIETLPLDGSVAFVMADTGVSHQLVEDEYNLRRATCAAAARALGLRSLRALDRERLEARREDLSAEEADCARHVMEENRRVAFGSRALREGDFEQFGQYMLQSHESSRDLYRNSCPELDAMVEVARQHPACLGARLTGGGFGGATLHLVRESAVEDFIRHLQQGYHAATGRQTDPLRCRVVDGAGAMETTA